MQPMKDLPQTPIPKPIYLIPNRHLHLVADEYHKTTFGVPLRRISSYELMSNVHAQRIARMYDAMLHEPYEIGVASAYAQFKKETKAQFEALVAAGYTFNFLESNPYQNDPVAMCEDLKNHKHLYVFLTEAGFGTNPEFYQDHPLLDHSTIFYHNKPLRYNDMFRAVHDCFSHALEALTFDFQSEYNAWRVHCQLYSASARRALTTETLGQNCWVFYGPYRNHNLNSPQTIFAPQKAGLLPTLATSPT